MLKWTGQNKSKGRAIIGLGLEEKNLEKLRADKPILIDGKVMGIAFDILIYYGKDMDTLMRITRGGIGPDTIIHDGHKP